MNTKTIGSLVVLLAIVSIAVSVPSAYAGHADEAKITMAEGSVMPGCEETAEGCFSPTTVTIVTGESVTWVNDDTMMHFATSGIAPTPDGIFDSGISVGYQFHHGCMELVLIPHRCSAPFQITHVAAFVSYN